MVSQVKRETMRACLSCPLCDSILRDATSICECLHTFCRKCIYEKITEDEIESCPVCNIDLGGTPLEKLRPDHNLQDLRARIFPLQRKKVKAPEIVSVPGRRKEISISSLVVSTPKLSEKAGRRTKAVARKESRGSGSLAERSVKNQGSFGDDTQKKSQVKKSYAESFSNKENKDDDEPWDSKLDFLVEVANRTKPFKSETATPKRLRRTQRKSSAATTFGDLGNSPQQERRNGPVWFSLVASSDQGGEASLPQIPANFLRIRDGNIPVSFIQKYLMGKLDLESETEIEIRCMGEAVIPTLKLQKLVDLWLQRSSKRQRLCASIGSSAKDYMMVLVYARKLPDCNNGNLKLAQRMCNELGGLASTAVGVAMELKVEASLREARTSLAAKQYSQYHSELAAEALYLMAMVYDKLGQIEEREEAAALFKKHIIAHENPQEMEPNIV